MRLTGRISPSKPIEDAARELRRLKTIWWAMIARCDAAERGTKERYRGVKVCVRWRESFLAFMYDMGSRPSPQHTLERRDNDRGYEPDNCKWATTAEQGANKKTNRYITFKGRTMHLAAWAREIGLSEPGLNSRLSRMSVRKALTTPRRNHTRRKRFVDMTDQERADNCPRSVLQCAIHCQCRDGDLC